MIKKENMKNILLQNKVFKQIPNFTPIKMELNIIKKFIV